MYLTEQSERLTLAERDRPAEIEVRLVEDMLAAWDRDGDATYREFASKIVARLKMLHDGLVMPEKVSAQAEDVMREGD